MDAFDTARLNIRTAARRASLGAAPSSAVKLLAQVIGQRKSALAARVTVTSPAVFAAATASSEVNR